MNAEELISCQEKYDKLKNDIDKYLIAYMNVFYKKIVELYKNFNSNISVLEHSNRQIKFKYYNYVISLSRLSEYGIPMEVLNLEHNYNIADIVLNKPDILFGKISAHFIEQRGNPTLEHLCDMFVNSEGVYKIERIISGTKTTFVDDCNVIIFDILSRIYTNSYPTFQNSSSPDIQK